VVLSFCGPAILVLLVTAWSAGLTLGAALVIHPALGDGVQASTGGPTPRLLYWFNSVVGMSVLSLTLTYLMQVYSALRERNVLGLKLHLATGETGDAAELLARLGPRGEFDTGLLSETAAELAATKDGHHFYPVLFYFRFDTPIYSVSRVCLVALDAVTLIRTALADRYGNTLGPLSLAGDCDKYPNLLARCHQGGQDRFACFGPPPRSQFPSKRSMLRTHRPK
jgi:hypothetical protein